MVKKKKLLRLHLLHNQLLKLLPLQLLLLKPLLLLLQKLLQLLLLKQLSNKLSDKPVRLFKPAGLFHIRIKLRNWNRSRT